MNFSLLVTGPPYGTQNAITAFLFSKAIINSANKLLSVFFHFDGVLNANKNFSYFSDEYDLVKQWIILNRKHCVKLNVCISAALRRGLTYEKKLTDKYLKKIDDLKSSFSFTGFSELAIYIEKSDRIIQF
ncbi:MAG: sulfurtransferase complex subunit TusD [Buchnera aphidicola (Nurudea yanoniella)]